MRQRLPKLLDRLLLRFFEVVPRTVLRWLPGSSRSFGPPRRWQDWRGYRARHNLKWSVVVPAHEERLPPPFFCSDTGVPFRKGKTVRWDDAGVAEIPGGRILDQHGWVVGAGDTFLGDFCQMGLAWHSAANRIVSLRRPQKLSGRILNLATAWAASNFFHYTVDGVGRWALVRRTGSRWDDFDRIVLPALQTPATAMIERALGIPGDRVIRPAHRGQFECDCLVQPSFPGAAGLTPGWVTEFYREVFPPVDTSRRRRRIFLVREGRRQPLDRAWLQTVAAEAGFETIDPLSTPDFRERLSEASHVLAVHGAGLANLIFCAPGTRVLELVPSEVARHPFFSTYFYSFCATAGMPYGIVVGRSLVERRRPFDSQKMSDYELRRDDVLRGIAALLEQ